MNYYEFHFTTIPVEDYQQDLLINALGEMGFETFEELDLGFKAYIAVANFSPEAFEDTLNAHRNLFTFSYEMALIPQKNWNQVWESNFEPMIILNKIFVRATFHEPNSTFPYEIVIDPKMAFGTGHHETTSMMLQFALETEFGKKRVLDMGCGTGILAIMASKLAANEIIAIDHDPICYESTIENVALNQVGNITALCGSAEAIPLIHFDIILANINRNVLIEQLSDYSKVLKTDGELYISGFYECPDLDLLTNEASKNGLKYIIHKVTNNWAAAKFVK